MTTASPTNMFSSFVQFQSALEETVLKVPADTYFILTDLIGLASIEVREGKDKKLKIQLGYSPAKNEERFPAAVSLKTGIVFRPGTEVVVFPFPVGLGRDSHYGYVTLSGYFMD